MATHEPRSTLLDLFLLGSVKNYIYTIIFKPWPIWKNESKMPLTGYQVKTRATALMARSRITAGNIHGNHQCTRANLLRCVRSYLICSLISILIPCTASFSKYKLSKPHHSFPDILYFLEARYKILRTSKCL